MINYLPSLQDTRAFSSKKTAPRFLFFAVPIKASLNLVLFFYFASRLLTNLLIKHSRRPMIFSPCSYFQKLLKLSRKNQKVGHVMIPCSHQVRFNYKPNVKSNFSQAQPRNGSSRSPGFCAVRQVEHQGAKEAASDVLNDDP